MVIWRDFCTDLSRRKWSIRTRKWSDEPLQCDVTSPARGQPTAYEARSVPAWIVSDESQSFYGN